MTKAQTKTLNSETNAGPSSTESEPFSINNDDRILPNTFRVDTSSTGKETNDYSKANFKANRKT